MQSLVLQTYLKQQGLEALQAAYGIKSRRHGEFKDLVCLKYPQYESPMDSVVVQQSRGIILDEANDWAVVSYPYDKFFHYGETNAAPIDWASATVQDKLDGLQQEGFIVCDRNFNRIKLKSSEYVKLSHLRDGSSYRKLLSVVINNESAEFLAYFQELQSLFDEITEQYSQLVALLEGEYEKYKDIGVQKDFALTVKDFPYSGVLFALRSGKARSVRAYMSGLPITKVEQYLEELV